MLLVPDGPAPPRRAGGGLGPRHHGNCGPVCAERTSNLFYDDYAAEARRLLDQGFVVAATDHHGLGTLGVHR